MNVSPPFPVDDDVWCLRTTGFWGLVANTFIVRSQGEIALIDAGYASEESPLIAGLAALGLTLDDVSVVLYTHTHPDHMGGGVAAGDLIRARQVVWDGTTPAFGDYNAFYAALPSWRAWIGDVLPDGPVRDATMPLFSTRHAPALGDGRLRNVDGVPLGGEVRVGALSFVCLDGRGHDPYHVAWYEPRLRWLFSGDVLLSNPTPLLPILRDDLPMYRDTVHRWQRLDVARLFPGHGRPSDAYGDAVARSCGHTRALYDSVAELLAGEVFDPALLVERGATQANHERQRLFITLAAVMTQLGELERLGVVRRRDDRRWERTGMLPAFTTLLSP